MEGNNKACTTIDKARKTTSKHLCATCENDGQAVSEFCIECLDYMCETCSLYHGRNKASRHHSVLQGKDIPDSPSAIEEIQDKTQCKIHDKQELTFFCQNHKEFLCVMCVAVTHKVCTADDLSKQTADSETEQFSGIGVSKTIVDAKSDAALVADYLKRQQEAVQYQSKASYKVELSKLNQTYQRLEYDINEHFDKQIENLRQCMGTFDKMKEESDLVDDVAQACSKHFSHSRSKTAIMSAYIVQKFSEFTDKVTKQSEINVDLLEWSENDGEKSGLYISKTQSLKVLCEEMNELAVVRSDQVEGSIPKPTDDARVSAAESTESNNFAHCLLSDTECVFKTVNIPSDKATCSPLKCLVDSQNRIFIVDSNNRKVKMFDMNFQHLYSIALPNKPVDACIVGSDRLVVVYENQPRLDMSNMKKKSLTDLLTKWRVKHSTLAVDDMGGNKIAIMVRNTKDEPSKDSICYIDIRKIDGMSINKVNLIQQGQLMPHFSSVYPTSLCLFKGQFLVGGIGGVVSLDENGEELWCYKNTSSVSITLVSDICASGDIVFVCGNLSGNVHRINPIYRSARKLSGLKQPRSLCAYNGGKCLLVCFEDKNDVVIYKV